MEIEKIGYTEYKVTLTDVQQSQVELFAEQTNMTQAEALDSIITDGFDNYDEP